MSPTHSFSPRHFLCLCSFHLDMKKDSETWKERNHESDVPSNDLSAGQDNFDTLIDRTGAHHAARIPFPLHMLADSKSI